MVTSLNNVVIHIIRIVDERVAMAVVDASYDASVTVGEIVTVLVFVYLDDSYGDVFHFNFY